MLTTLQSCACIAVTEIKKKIPSHNEIPPNLLQDYKVGESTARSNFQRE